MSKPVLVVRNRERRILTWSAWGLAPVFFVPGMMGGPGLALAGAGAVCVFLCFRGGRCAVRVHRDGIEVVNFTSTRRIPWGEVQGFEIAPSLLDPEMPWVVLRDGERIRLTGAQSIRTLLRDTAPHEQVSQLEEILETVHRTGAPWPGKSRDPLLD